MRFIELYMNVSSYRNKKQNPYLEMRLSCTFCLNFLLIWIYQWTRRKSESSTNRRVGGLIPGSSIVSWWDTEPQTAPAPEMAATPTCVHPKFLPRDP